MRKQKGFTLIELIIVIAIFGILMGVLVPSWGYFLERGRIRTQNNKAKAIFNAAQTIVTDLNFAERRHVNAYTSTTDADTKKAALTHLYSQVPRVEDTAEKRVWYYYWDGNEGYRCDADGIKLTKDNLDKSSDTDDYTDEEFSALMIDEWDEKIGAYIKKIVDEQDMVYKFYVKDYKVMSVVSSRFESDRYLGAYPISLDKVDELDRTNAISISDIKSAGVQSATMTYFDLETDDIES